MGSINPAHMIYWKLWINFRHFSVFSLRNFSYFFAELDFWEQIGYEKRDKVKRAYFSILLALDVYSYVRTYNLRQNIWNKVKKSSKIGQDYKNLISKSASFYNAIFKV